MVKRLAWGKAWQGRSYDLGKMTLSELWAAYLTCPAINLYILLAIITATYALVTAKSWGRLVWPVIVVFILYPFVWYGLHRFILHGRWLYKMNWSAGLWKRIHFDHHQDPHKLEVLFGSPANTIPTMLVITGPVGYLISGWSGACAAFSMALITTCVYEFFHCIQHLNYKPKSPLVQKLKREHMLHHFHNESANMGIVSFSPDRIFHSYFKTAKDCPKSRTVFNLGYDLEEARRYPKVMELTGAPPRDKPPTALETKTEQVG